ncbi:MAG: carboxypeptidase M32 [Bdellovibrionota bacterium]
MTEEEILSEYRKIATLGSISSLLGWDQESHMPSGALNLRLDQLALLSTLSHSRMTSSSFVDAILSSPSKSAHIERLKIEVAKQRALSSDFVEKLSRATAECTEIWKKARAEKDFEMVRPHLETLIALNQQRIAAFRKDPILKARFDGLSDYEVLLGEYDPGLKAATVRKLLGDVAIGLKARIPKILERQKARAQQRDAALPRLAMPLPEQRQLLNTVIDAFGFDRAQGLIAESTHPFCGGSEDDVRMTTRFRESDFTDSLSGAIHECGHALYEQGLPRETLRTPCGRSDSMAIHESQSRLYENFIGRSRPFFRYLSTLSDRKPEELDLILNWSELTSIRVDADEVTYNLHVVLRMELEEKLINGELDARDLPQAWRTRFKDLFGYDVADDAEGCLQDIHWYSGAFGYFPSYALGNLLSAELFKEYESVDSSWAERAEQGDFKKLREFLRERVHALGCFEDTPTRIRKMLGGRDFGTEAFLAYIDRKYLP